MKEEDIRKREVLNKYLELSAKDIDVYFKDQTKFIELKYCVACGSEQFSFLFDKESFKFCQCDSCATIFVNPRPDIDSMNRYYSDSPSTTYWVNEFFLPVAEVRREKMFKPRAEFIAEYFKNEDNLSIADIGAGFGLFLEELKKIRPDFNITAIEPSNEMAVMCRNKGFEVVHSSLEDVDARKYGFDVLTSFELFEHLHDPAFFLEKVFDLLNPLGYLVITTLNGLGFDIQVLWEKAKSISPPHHLNFTNPWSIEILLKTKGFNIVEIETPGKLDWDIVESNYLKEDMDPGRLWKTVSKFADDKAKTELQRWISENKFSSHMRIIAQKPA